MARIAASFLILLSLSVAGFAASQPNILEKNFSFPPPIQWRSGNWEVSLTGLAWGPANSPQIISKGHKEGFSREKPEFFPDCPYVLALQFRAFAQGLVSSDVWGSSGLVLIKDVSGDLQSPMVLTPSGFLRFTADLHFDHTNTTEFWDFFPVAPHQKQLLFQSFGSAPVGSPGNLRASFRILLRRNNLMVMNAMPGAKNACSNFTKDFVGNIGSNIHVNVQLTAHGTDLTGTEQYVRIGKTLWLVGRVDSLGNFVLKELYPKDHWTGIFKGHFSRSCQSVSGYFSKPDGSRLLPFEFNDGNLTR